MKKGTMVWVVMTALILTFPLVALATEECNHDLWRMGEYEQYDSDYHLSKYKCGDCGEIVEKKEEHDFSSYYYNEEFKTYDDKYHIVIKKCSDCGAVREEKEEHDLDSYGEDFKKIDGTYHGAVSKCDDCGAEVITSQKKHDWDDGECIKKATLTKKGKIRYYCSDCLAYKDQSIPWKYNTEYSLTYNVVNHSAVYKNSDFVTVQLERPAKGAVLKVKINGKTYTQKNTNNSKKIKVKIKKSPYGSKMTVNLFYKNKCVGTDVSDEWNNVLYAKDIKKGMTKKQVKFLYYWGAPDSTASASGGWVIWWYDDGSYIYFKKGKVKYWYNAVG